MITAGERNLFPCLPAGKGTALSRRARSGTVPVPPVRNKRRLFTKKWFFLVIITSLLLIIGGCSTVVFTAGTVDLKKIENLEYASVIYDQEGKLIGRIGVNRERITIEELKNTTPISSKPLSRWKTPASTSTTGWTTLP